MHVLLTGNTAFMIANFRQGIINHLVRAGHKVTVLAPEDEHVSLLVNLGCAYVPISMKRNGMSPLQEIKLLWRLYRKIKNIQPDLVLGYTIKNNIYAGYSCRKLKIPFVPNVTGLGPSFNKSSLLKILVQLMYRGAFAKAKKVFFQNGEDLDRFVNAALIKPSQAKLLPGSGVNLSKFKETELPDTLSGIRFLLVSRMLWDKGVGVFVEASMKVRETFPEARFQLLGPLDTESRSGISRKQIEEWHSGGFIEYLGSTQKVFPFLKKAHCIVLPSYYREGTPKVLLEAGAVGRALITTNTPGCRDLVRQGQNGFLVNPRSVDDLVEACQKFLMLSSFDRAAFGAKSRKLIEEKYDEQFVVAAYAEIFDDLEDQRYARREAVL